MDVAQILAMGRRWWWLLALGVLFSVAAYAVATQVRGDRPQPSYQASVTLFVTLPTLPASAFTADSAKQPWELDRLMATYAQMAKSRTVAERAVRDGGLQLTAGDLAAHVATDTFGYTQLLRISVSAAAPADAEASADAVVRAFAEVRAEQSIPGVAAVYETSPAVRADSPVPVLVNVAIVVLAGLVASSGVIIAFEHLGPAAVRAPAVAVQRQGGGMRPPASHERAL